VHLECITSPVSTPRALLAGGALAEIVPASDVPCLTSATARSAPAVEQRVMSSHEPSAPLTEVLGPFLAGAGLETLRFPIRDTFCRDRSNRSLRYDLPRVSLRGRSSRLSPRAPVCPIPTAKRQLPRAAASFGLGTLLVRALASPHPSDAEMLPSDVCHPNFSA